MGEFFVNSKNLTALWNLNFDDKIWKNIWSLVEIKILMNFGLAKSTQKSQFLN